MLDKILELKSFFVGAKADGQDIGMISGWYDEAKKLLFLDDLSKHKGMEYVTKVFQDEVLMIDEKLKTTDSKELPDHARDRLLDRKSLAEKYLSLFDGIDVKISKLEDQVDDELTKI